MKKVIVVVFISLSVSSCAFVAMPKCELPDENALELCNKPTSLPERYKYAEALELHVIDRESLSKCKIKHSTLVKMLDSCNKRIDKYNEIKGQDLD